MSESRAEVLIVDDDPAFLRLAEAMLHSNGYSTRCVESGESALAALDERFPDVILLDQQLGSVDGMSLIEPLKQRAPDVSVVLVTAYSTVDAAVRAIKLGAHDFLAKPLDEARLVAILAKAIEHRDLVDRLHRLEGERTERSEFSGMVGASPAMQTIYRIIENVAATNSGVMIVGESGTGKELVAQAIHDRSPRSSQTFVPINMGALPRELVESTLFGHERGAFTGADRARIGCCEEAAGGTLFLDEIREMPIETQSKLLRYLQEKVFRRVGGSKDIESDARIICATNSDPLADVRQNRLRLDLYYRLNVVPIHLPPLRDRPDDIPLLAQHALRRWSARHDKAFDRIDAEASERLARYVWPGNVRQLFHTIERIVVLNSGPAIEASMLPADLEHDQIEPTETAGPESADIQPIETTSPARAADEGSAEDSILPLAEVERNAIEHALRHCRSAAKAARLLGISEATMYRRLRDYGLKSNG